MFNVEINNIFSLIYYPNGESIGIICKDLDSDEIKLIQNKEVNYLSFDFDYEDSRKLRDYLD